MAVAFAALAAAALGMMAAAINTASHSVLNTSLEDGQPPEPDGAR